MDILYAADLPLQGRGRAEQERAERGGGEGAAYIPAVAGGCKVDVGGRVVERAGGGIHSRQP